MRADDEFSILTGSEFLIVVGLQMGCRGFVGGLHNVCPHIAVELYNAFRAGDLETARQKQQALIETWQIFRHGAIWGAFDEALRWLGLCERATGAPYVTALTPEEQVCRACNPGKTCQAFIAAAYRLTRITAVDDDVLSGDVCRGSGRKKYDRSL